MMTKTEVAARAFEAVSQAAETIKNDEPATINQIEPGDVCRQGDLYLVALYVPLPGKPFGSRQLAPGTTQGSRHIVKGRCKVQTVDETEAVAAINRLVPTTRGQRLFIGPQIIASGAVTITHPEHGHRTLPPGTYLTTYQRTWAQEVRRTMD